MVATFVPSLTLVAPFQIVKRSPEVLVDLMRAVSFASKQRSAPVVVVPVNVPVPENVALPLPDRLVQKSVSVLPLYVSVDVVPLETIVLPVVIPVVISLSTPLIACRVEPVLVRFAPSPEKLVQESVSVVGLYVSVDVVPLETIVLPVAIPVVTSLSVESIPSRVEPVLVRFAPLP